LAYFDRCSRWSEPCRRHRQIRDAPLEDAITASTRLDPGTQIEEWNGEFDLLERYWQLEMEALRPKPEIQAQRGLRPTRRRHSVLEPVGVDDEEQSHRQSKRSDDEVLPGVFVGETARKMRKRVAARLERDEARQARRDEPVTTEPGDHPDPLDQDASMKTRDGTTTETFADGAKEWKAYFIRIQSSLLRRTDISPGAKILHGWLVNQANVERHWRKPFAPLQEVMAAQLGTHRKRIGGYLAELEDLGLISRRRRGARNATVITLINREN
jgi:hypothetical protein